MKRLLWTAVFAAALLTACNEDQGQCWTRSEDDGQAGAGGAPIVPGGGGYGDTPGPKPQGTTDPATMGGCDNEWSKIAACSNQYARDRARCQKAQTARCWSSAMDRLAYCNKTNGQTDFPELDD